MNIYLNSALWVWFLWISSLKAYILVPLHGILCLCSIITWNPNEKVLTFVEAIWQNLKKLWGLNTFESESLSVRSWCDSFCSIFICLRWFYCTRCSYQVEAAWTAAYFHSFTHTRTQDISDYMLSYGLFVKAFVKSISPQLLDLPLLWAHFSPFHSTHLSASPLSVGDSCISDRHFPFHILTWHLLSFPVSTSQSAPAVFLANPNRHWRKYWEKMICMTKAAVLLVCAPSGWGCCILSDLDQVLSSLLY